MAILRFTRFKMDIGNSVKTAQIAKNWRAIALGGPEIKGSHCGLTAELHRSPGGLPYCVAKGSMQWHIADYL